MSSSSSEISSSSPSISAEEKPPKTTTSIPPDTTKSPESEPAIEQSKTLKPEKLDEQSTDPSPTGEEKGNEEEEEEQGECGFCLFMKGGECREPFINWEKCVEEGEEKGEDIVNKCFEATSALKKCMDAHPDYYGPVLQAEKAAQQELNDQLDKEKEAIATADQQKQESS